MDFSLSPEQQQIRDEVRKLCVKFDDAYWLEKDRTGDFPHELHAALAAAGWLGIAMPEAYGGAGLGITEAVIMMQAIAESGAAMSGASAVHINIFGLQPVVVFGTDEQKRRMLPPLIAGKDKACFAVTEPDAGLDTTAIKVRAARRGDHYLLSGQKIWISTAQVANKILILARTTPLDRVKRKTEGLSLFYTDLDPVSACRRCTGRPHADRRARRRPPLAVRRGSHRVGCIATFGVTTRSLRVGEIASSPVRILVCRRFCPLLRLDPWTIPCGQIRYNGGVGGG